MPTLAYVHVRVSHEHLYIAGYSFSLREVLCCVDIMCRTEACSTNGRLINFFEALIFSVLPVNRTFSGFQWNEVSMHRLWDLDVLHLNPRPGSQAPPRVSTGESVTRHSLAVRVDFPHM